MKKIIAFFISSFLIFSLSACGNGSRAQPSEERNTETVITESQSTSAQTTRENAENTDSRILIAYFSVPEDVDTSGVDAISGASIVVKDGEVMGNTEYTAKVIQETIGGDLFRIETVDAYPMDHDPLVDQAADEQDDHARPELASHIENLERYDTIILGFPNWWGDLPMPVYTFLEEYDFGAKTIIPFVTHGGSGFSNTCETISELQPGAFVSENTLCLSRNDVADSEEEIRQWAESLGLNAKADVPENNSDTVANAVADPQNQQTLYLWEEGNVPAITEYTENNGNYFDDPDFRPYLVTFPVPQALSEQGFQSFVVNYRLHPYT